MRYYLDTNMLYFILSKDDDEVHFSVANLLNDYSSTLYTSSIAIQELLLLYKIGKFRSRLYKSEQDILATIKLLHINVVFFNERHLNTYTALQIADGHKDMNDHAVISQAISDKIPIISSDAKFSHYTNQGLIFIYNKR